MSTDKPKCRDCDNDADPTLTMDFTDVEPGAYIYWCSECGVVAHRMQKAIDKALVERPDFADKLREEIDKRLFIA